MPNDVTAAVAYTEASSAILALRMLQARSAAGTLASASAIVEKLPIELFAAVEDALMDLGWSAAYRKHFIALGFLGCDCQEPCHVELVGIDAHAFGKATPVCQERLVRLWYSSDFGVVQSFHKASESTSRSADTARRSKSS